MAPFFLLNGKVITRAHVVKYWRSGNVVNVTDITGDTETKEFDSDDDAQEAMKLLKNLTVIEDIDGLRAAQVIHPTT